MRRMSLRAALLGTALLIAVAALPTLAPAAGGAWDPAAFVEQSTLQFLTVGPEEGEHWTTVWLVVLDDQLYIRLGTGAAGRMERSTRKPIVQVRIAGQEFTRVRAEEAPDMVARVATAMSEKYWTDLLIRYSPHPLTMRLVPVESP